MDLATFPTLADTVDKRRNTAQTLEARYPTSNTFSQVGDVKVDQRAHAFTTELQI
jgi:hypothetical protein